MKKINWINSWAKGNKKEGKVCLAARFGRITLFELKACLFCEESCSSSRFRLIILNFGIEI